ncbi:discoidin domain-containing protein [Clostridium sp. Marseille-QA1073]
MANWKSVMPTMNGYTDEKTDTVVSASSEYDTTNSAWKAFDGIYGGGNYWCTKTGENTGWLKVGFNFNRYIIKRYGILSHASFYPVDWNFEGSNDGETWVVLHSIVGGKDGSKWSYYEFDNKRPYRYYRINVTKGAGALLYIFEMQLFVDLDAPSVKTLFLIGGGEKVYDDDGQVGAYPPSEDIFKEYGLEDIEDLFNEESSNIKLKKNQILENGIVYNTKINKKNWENIEFIKSSI